MAKMLISPSLLAADFTRLGREAEAVAEAGADMLHLDVMDGVFVPNISFGMPVIAALRRTTGLLLDTHIMIVRPDKHIASLAKAGADLITFHLEAAEDPEGVVGLIRGLGKKAGIALRPGTPAAAVLPLLPFVQLVLVMTVEPGFGGQPFMGEMLPKIEEVAGEARRLGLHELMIQVDGGIDETTAPLCAARGANCFVAGSAVFGKEDVGAAMAAIRRAARGVSP